MWVCKKKPDTDFANDYMRYEANIHTTFRMAGLRQLGVLSPVLDDVPNLIDSRLYHKYEEERALLTELQNLRQRKRQRLREKVRRSRKELEEMTETSTGLQASVAIHELEASSSSIDVPDRPRSAKALNRMYRQRKASLLHKVYEIGELCGANVFLQIERNSKVSQYKNSQREPFPLSPEELVSSPYTR